jgi:hypothetical protein
LCRYAAGNTPLHNAAYDGWCEGIELLCEHGAKLNASNNVRNPPTTHTHTTKYFAPAHTQICNTFHKK